MSGGNEMKRTILRSKKGKKLYAKRNKKGQFVDIQSYQKAHKLDMIKKSKEEKKNRLQEYIKQFAKAISGYTFPEVRWDKEWIKMWKKINKLHLF